MSLSFSSSRRARSVQTLALSVLTTAAAACGGTGGDLFGSGGATSVSGTTSSTSGTATASSGSTTSSGTTTSSSGTTTTSSSGTTTSSSGTTTTSSSGTTTSSSSSTTSSSGATGCQAGYTCVDDAPPGWTGHYYVNEKQLPSPAAPPCPANLTATTDHASPAGAAQCTACSCSALQGAACGGPDIKCWSGSTTCGGNNLNDPTAQLQNGACDVPMLTSFGGAGVSCKLNGTSTIVSAGSCAPSTSDFPNKASWQERIYACGTTALAGSCGAGKVCVPDGSGAAGESLCLRQDGNATCPAGWTTTITAFTGATDTRACGACTCGAGNPTCSAGHYTFYPLNNCGTVFGSPVEVNSNQCTEVSNDFNGARATLPTLTGGSCPAGGGGATGTVTPTGPVTYCCQ